MGAKRLRDLKLCGVAMLIMAMFSVVHLIAIDWSWLRRLELLALDEQMRLRGREQPGPETVIVMIDDQTIAALGRWPVPRQTLAQLVTVLHRAGARTIGVDLLFADPEPARDGESADAALAQAFAQAGNVVLPFTFRFGGRPEEAKPFLTRAAYRLLHKSRDYRPVALRPTGVIAPLTMLAQAATLGHSLVAYDIDGAPRYDYPALEYDVDYYPSMAVRIAQLYLDVPWSEVEVELGRGISLGRVQVPTDPEARILVNYLGPSRTFPTYSLAQVLSGAVPSSVFRDRIVLVGADTLGTPDTFQSPFTAVMPGVERLATVIDSILHGHQLRRPASAPWFEVGLMLGAALLLGFAMSRLSLALAFLCAVAVVVAIAVSGQIALTHYGVWQMDVVPIVAIMLSFTVLSLYRYGLLDKERRHIRRVFQRYLAPDMVDKVVSDQRLPQLGGELRDLTILFCDLRGFTALSERLDPGALTRIVNQFFAVATEAILEQGGTIDKYLGDAVMAFWNAPADQPDHATLACRAALRILDKVGSLNESAALDGGLPRLEVGVGINTGPCTVGNFGSSRRFDYSAIGDAVNVAARLEHETRAYGIAILLGPETAARVADLAILPITRIRLRGRAEAVEVYALIGDEQVLAAPAFRELRSNHLHLRAGSTAADEARMRHLVAELKARSPPARRPLYDVFAMQVAEKTGTLASDALY
jgi:adenylate cyclase